MKDGYKLSQADKDAIIACVQGQLYGDAVAFVEKLVTRELEAAHAKALDSGSDQASGSAPQATGSSAGAKDTGKKARGGG